MKWNYVGQGTRSVTVSMHTQWNFGFHIKLEFRVYKCGYNHSNACLSVSNLLYEAISNSV
jgi:hypothetical protein